MARKKKSMIGFDPLAWLDDDAVDKSDNNEVIESASPVTHTSGEMVNVLGKDIDINALVKSYGLIKDSLTGIVTDFYAELFSQYPAVIPLFKNTDEAGRAAKLSAALTLLFDNIQNEGALIDVLSDLGERHQAYGAEEAHYGIVAGLLIETCHKHVGRSWTKKMTASWKELMDGVAETMLSAYYDKPSLISKKNEEIIADEPINETIESVSGDVLMLENIQDISKSEELKAAMLEMVKSSDHINVDASLVARIDGSALQLLCGLFQYAKINGIKMGWVDPSDALLSAIEFVNLGEELELDYFGLF